MVVAELIELVKLSKYGFGIATRVLKIELSKKANE